MATTARSDIIAPMSVSDRFKAAIELFDAANREDPSHTIVDGMDHPDALLYSRRMTDGLHRLEPNASEPLQLAARCQHIRRWQIPRSRYPMTRAGYHEWRNDLAQFHATEAASLLRQAGYDSATVIRVQSLLRKEHLKTDSDMQILEDVICLVFIEFYFSDFAKKHEEEKLIKIVQRTWKKMSPRGQAAALKLQIEPGDRWLIEKALTRAPG
ncbi:MAG TPA: DUF4202 domain-containing protein [Tepidisphaeraceae bacterium]|jgi:hypothetical protein|nr:DUF4202 domain-containing protein [Tepidisphaeraceae bacterium]